MKRFSLAAIFLCTLVCNQLMAQKKFNYASAWKSVDSLMNKGLPKQASEKINLIYDEAKRTDEQQQWLKALIYKATVVSGVEEDDWKKNLKLIAAAATTAKEPARQIMYSLKADLLRKYLENQRWKIYQRTPVTGKPGEDMETWTVDDFHSAISANYLQSLQNPALLQQTGVEAFDSVMLKGNSRKLRPTLFDVLAHEALNYFTRGEAAVTKPAAQFELNDFASLAPAKRFVAYAYESASDASSPVLAAIRIYQQLLAFRLKDNNTAALVDADIARISYAYQHSVHEYKDQLYKEALEFVFENYPGEPYAMEAGYLLAEWWNARGQAYKPGLGTPEDRDALNIAAGICADVVKRFPKSEGGIHAQNLLKTLNTRQLELETEKVNLTKKPFRALVQFKNTDTVYLRLLKVDRKLEQVLSELSNPYAYGRGQNEYWTTLSAWEPLREWTQALPATQDLRKHAAEIKIDGLDIGTYLLIGSTSKSFSLPFHAMAATVCRVSDIAFARNTGDYFVLNRQSGKPLPGAKVKFWSSEYDYGARKQVKKLAGEGTTDSKGKISAPVQKSGMQEGNLIPEIAWNNDYLYVDESEYSQPLRYQWEDDNRKNYDLKTAKGRMAYQEANTRFFFFTDRALYRPGQQVFFKALGVTKNTENLQSQLYLSDKPVTVVLFNASGQKIDSLQLKINAFGSLQGKFDLPKSGLTGDFTIQTEQFPQSSATFKMEAYKRPKFYVTVQPPQSDYRPGDSVEIKGTATAYAGNPLDGAKVSYRVYRSARFTEPWRLRSWWGIPASGEKTEITNGTAVTDDKGGFTVIFTAIPDKSISKTLNPAFDYTVEAAVTDINGETHESTGLVTIGYQTLQVKLNQNGRVYQKAGKLLPVAVEVTNLTDVPQKTAVLLTMSPLSVPGNMYKERYWSAPDTFVMSKETFASYFPHDEYHRETDYQTWETLPAIWEKQLSEADKKDSIQLPAGLKPGWYKITATAKDKNGTPASDIRYIAIYDAQQLPAPVALAHPQSGSEREAGEKAVFLHGSSIPGQFTIQQVVRPKTEHAAYEFLEVPQGWQEYSFTTDSSDRGGLVINRFFIWENRVYASQWSVGVPWSDKMLQVQLNTFRNKLLPGQQETWSVKISGKQKEKLAAEMLASMYDASLDQIYPHLWQQPGLWPVHSYGRPWSYASNFAAARGQSFQYHYDYMTFAKSFDELLKINGYTGLRRNIRIRGASSVRSGDMMPVMMAAPPPVADAMAQGMPSEMPRQKNETLQEVVITQQKKEVTPKTDNSSIQIRKDFRETVFFMPELRTTAEGDIRFEFTMPEALTQWKLQLFAHTKELATGMLQATAITQKDLMVQPNVPRFMRQGDQMELAAKIVNLQDHEVTGTAKLELLNASTMTPVDGWFMNVFPQQYFTASANGSTSVRFPISIPAQFTDALVYRITATTTGTAGTQASDGEEMALPVLTNRILVTESLPLNLRNTNKKSFQWTRLLESAGSPTLQHQAFTLEFTTNPAWSAVQALPYLMEYPYDCAEQTWNKFYANAIATRVANSTPRIKAVFESWKNKDTAALLSSLQKNENLKSALLEETPWVLAAKNETEQKRQIAQLFDMVRMSEQSETALQKLEGLQSSNGGFVWFKGGPDDRYMTQYIITGIGHLRKLNAWPASLQQRLSLIAKKAITYLDARVQEDYEQLLNAKVDLKRNHLSDLAIQYLYMRSFFPEADRIATTRTSYDFYFSQAKKFWLSSSKYQQGMIALVLHRGNDTPTADGIIRSLTENSLVHEEMGMYWKEFNNPGYYWWQAPIESHALLLEAFAEIENNTNRINDLKTWLLKNKQTTSWKTTRATAEACYALLMTGSDWLSSTPSVTIDAGGWRVQGDEKAEQGTGYFSQTVTGEKVKPEMGNIEVRLKETGKPQHAGLSSWGAAYWQYFENLDKITPAASPLSVQKSMFLITPSPTGPVLKPIDHQTPLKPGDKLTARIIIQSDRNMEYVHLKDMRAACLEPLARLSGYQYQGGLGYYQAPADASMHFFIGYLPKGTYVLEYPVYVTHTGTFSNGITTIQCMYAPEFSSHSEGITIQVNE